MSSVEIVLDPRYAPPKTEAGAKSVTRLSELLHIWLTERRPSLTSISRVSRSVRRFIDLNGDLALNDFTKDQMRYFLRELRRVPKMLPRHLLDKPMQAILRYSHDNPGLTTLAPTSIRAYLKDMQMIFNWAIAMDLCASNPANNLRIVDHRDKSKLRVAFDMEDLKLIFERAPLYAGCKAAHRRKHRGTLIIKDSLFWVPLVALFTGARLGEIAEATTNDFKKDGDIVYLDVQAPTGNRRLKTKAANRAIPIHPELIRMGFLRYLERQRELGHRKVFLEIQGQRSIQDSRGWSQYWRHFQESARITDRRKVFHSFRHTFKRACRDCGIDEEVHDVLTGHRPYESGRRYGQGIAFKTLHRAISKVHFEGLDLSHLYEGASAN